MTDQLRFTKFNVERSEMSEIINNAVPGKTKKPTKFSLNIIFNALSKSKLLHLMYM